MTEGGRPPLPPRAGPIIDADGHVLEPESAWAALPEPFRPRISADASGHERVVVDDTEVLALPLRTLIPPGSSLDDVASYRSLADARPGGSDPLARLGDMDAEGIDQVVLYPTIGLSFSVVEDPAAAVALAGACNDWLAGYCAAEPRRLFGAATLPLQDPAAAARELRRAVTELGLVAGVVPPHPCRGRSLSDRTYDVVWEVAEELDVPIGIHGGSPVLVPTPDAERPSNPLVLHAVSHPFGAMLACAELIAAGTLERHRGLRLLFLGSSGGWVPFWLERLDEQAERVGGVGPDMVLHPSEYFARQCAVSFGVGERTLPALASFVGAERIVWGSDGPHGDATLPGALDAVRATIAPCTTATQAKVLGVNARGIYRLPARQTGPAAVIGDYFTAVTAQDPSLLRRVFAPDATFDVDGDVRRGHEDILRYYTEKTFVFADFRPAPGPFQVDGTTVTVDIDVHLGGNIQSVRDVFTTDGEHITALQVRGFADVLRAAGSR